MIAAIAQVLDTQAGRDADDVTTIRWYYQVGVLVWPEFTAWIVGAEADGVTVRLEPRRGILRREGWVTLDGPWGAIRRHLQNWRRLCEETT